MRPRKHLSDGTINPLWRPVGRSRKTTTTTVPPVDHHSDLEKVVRNGALELEKKYPELGQLFVESMGDSLRLSKSQIPWGSFTMKFDPFSKRVGGSFRFQSGYAGDVLFEMSPAGSQETVELWSGGQAYSDADIIDLIFDN